MPDPEIYSLRCFYNGKRRFTDKLGSAEALRFRQAALHLANYLTREYSLPGAVGGHAAAESDKPSE